LLVLLRFSPPDNEEEDSQHRRLLVRRRNKERPVHLTATAPGGVSFAIHIIIGLSYWTNNYYVVMLLAEATDVRLV